MSSTATTHSDRAHATSSASEGFVVPLYSRTETTSKRGDQNTSLSRLKLTPPPTSVSKQSPGWSSWTRVLRSSDGVEFSSCCDNSSTIPHPAGSRIKGSDLDRNRFPLPISCFIRSTSGQRLEPTQEQAFLVTSSPSLTSNFTAAPNSSARFIIFRRPERRVGSGGRPFPSSSISNRRICSGGSPE